MVSGETLRNWRYSIAPRSRSWNRSSTPDTCPHKVAVCLPICLSFYLSVNLYLPTQLPSCLSIYLDLSLHLFVSRPLSCTHTHAHAHTTHATHTHTHTQGRGAAWHWPIQQEAIRRPCVHVCVRACVACTSDGALRPRGAGVRAPVSVRRTSGGALAMS